MAKDKRCISKLVSFLIKNNRLIHSYLFYIIWSKKTDYIRNHYYKARVEERDLIQLIENSKRIHIIRYYLPDILFQLDENSFTEKVFHMCLTYPKEYCTTLLSTLAHIELNTCQLEQLDQVLTTEEAFHKLLNRYYCSEKCCKDDFRSFIYNHLQYVEDLLYWYKTYCTKPRSELQKEKHLVLIELFDNQRIKSEEDE